MKTPEERAKGFVCESMRDRSTQTLVAQIAATIKQAMADAYADAAHMCDFCINQVDAREHIRKRAKEVLGE